jgi:hypothetical protein
MIFQYLMDIHKITLHIHIKLLLVLKLMMLHGIIVIMQIYLLDSHSMDGEAVEFLLLQQPQVVLALLG